jgi:hypothetical protein
MATPPVLTPEVLRPRDSRPGPGPGAVLGIAIGCFAAVLVGRQAGDHVTPVPPIATVALAPPIMPAAVEVASRRIGPAAFELDVAPVIADGGLFVLLSSRVEAAWLKGGDEPTMRDDEGLTIVEHPLGPRGRAAFAAALGARLRLYRADGSSCLTRVKGVVGLARIDHGGELDAGSARRAWKAADGGAQVIAGQLEPIEGRCDDARIARSEALPAPATARPQKASDELHRRVAPALFALPIVSALFDSRPPGDSPVEIVTFTAGGETVVQATLFGEGCTGQEPVIVAFWRLDAAGALEHLGHEQGPSLAIMAAGTGPHGRLELVVSEDVLGSALLRRTGKDGRFELTDRAAVAVLGCRC